MSMGQWDFGGEKETRELLGEMWGLCAKVHGGSKATPVLPALFAEPPTPHPASAMPAKIVNGIKPTPSSC